MNTSEISRNLLDNQEEIKAIFAKYGAKNVRIWGIPETESDIEPDVDILISFDKADQKRAPILICFRNGFLHRVRRMKLKDQSAYLLFEDMARLLSFPVNMCHEGAVKLFHPATYEKTVDTHKWNSIEPPLGKRSKKSYVIRSNGNPKSGDVCRRH